MFFLTLAGLTEKVMIKMAILTTAPRGTQDILPEESEKWRYLENKLINIAYLYGFREIRVPSFEHTELFNRSVGDTTDVVQKEMYTFEDKGGRSITLRPEGTAGVLRSAIEHGLLSGALPVKLAYLISAFRYEKPQAGRLREFHQFGVEMIGSPASADAEIISMADFIFKELKIDAVLEINSIGCQSCRDNYQKALKRYFSSHIESLCDTCKERLERNPMRILDCKKENCKKVSENAPLMLDYLCDECRRDFSVLQQKLDSLQISYTVNPKIVRGLDYYTKTVFEFINAEIGAQSTICGGGRYDGLIRQLGGQDLPGIGFAIGLERLIMLMEKNENSFPPQKSCDVYVGSAGAAAQAEAEKIISRLRAAGFWAEGNLMNRSVKAQMKYADKSKARFSVIIGENELKENLASLKDMSDGSVYEVLLNGDSSNQNSLVKTIGRFLTPNK